MYSDGRSETVLNQEYAHSEDSTIEKLSSVVLLLDLTFVKQITMSYIDHESR